MKKRYIILLLIIGLFLYLAREKEPTPSLPPKQNNPNIVAYDWDKDRYITKQMADTMILTGGKWYGKSSLEIPSTKKSYGR